MMTMMTEEKAAGMTMTLITDLLRLQRTFENILNVLTDASEPDEDLYYLSQFCALDDDEILERGDDDLDDTELEDGP